MGEAVSALFDEYTLRFARGERPDPVAYLERAGEGRRELRDLIDGFLMTAPPPEPSADLVAVLASWTEKGTSPLVDLRTRRGAKRDEVVDALVTELGVDVSKRGKVARYYHRLESGLLDLTRVDGRVFSALAKALGARLSDLVFPPRPAVPPTASAGAYLRSSAEAEELLDLRLDHLAQEEERDDVDELFEGPA